MHIMNHRSIPLRQVTSVCRCAQAIAPLLLRRVPYDGASCTGCRGRSLQCKLKRVDRPPQVDPDDGAEQVDEKERVDEDDDQLTRVDDELTSGVQVRHDRLDQLTTNLSHVVPAPQSAMLLISIICLACLV